MSRDSPPKLVVATSFPIDPPLGGGQLRIRGLYGALSAAGVVVDVVALVPYGDRGGTRELTPGLREHRVPRSAEHETAERALASALGTPATDVALGVHHALTPAYATTLRACASSACAAVASHPYAWPALVESCPGVPLLYEAHNVEYDLKRSLFPGETQAGAAALGAVKELERSACRDAALIVACSREDAARLSELYAIDRQAVAIVANGYDVEGTAYTGAADRAALRTALGVDRFTVAFVGSWHGPNLEAANAVCAAARRASEMHFVVAGSAGLALDDCPENVDLTGPVPEGFLRGLLATADIAVNPMTSGSGTNLKMLQYAAAGVPLVSTVFGARGLGFVAEQHYAPCRADELDRALLAIREEAPTAVAERSLDARRLVAAHFDWTAVAERWLQDPAMERLLAC